MRPLRIAVIVGCWTAPRQAIHQLPARRGPGKTQQDKADFKFSDISRLPVYNRSIPASLKSLYDGLSPPTAQKGQTVWAGIPAAVIGSSPGGASKSMVQQHLRNGLYRGTCLSPKALCAGPTRCWTPTAILLRPAATF